MRNKAVRGVGLVSSLWDIRTGRMWLGLPGARGRQGGKLTPLKDEGEGNELLVLLNDSTGDSCGEG